MRTISLKQQQKNKELQKIKASLPKLCKICGYQANDLAHILPKSLYPEYYTNELNLIILCRNCHNLFDNNIGFRKKQIELYNIAYQIDIKAAIKYFKNY